MTLHLVRGRPPPPAALAPGDRVLYDEDGAWTDRAAPTPRPLSDDAVLDLAFRAARVVVW